MILLVGGTRETAIFAQRIVELGYRVLVSTATDFELDIGDHPDIERRSGRLDFEGFCALIHENSIEAIVDAAHPYAYQVRETVSRVALKSNIPCIHYLRSPVATQCDDVVFANDHFEGADIAFSFSEPVLLTIGSQNVGYYSRKAALTGIPVIARVLDNDISIASCIEQGIPADAIITGRGPFTVEQNREVIRKNGIGVLVTKDSGDAGGTKEKLRAACEENCRVIVIRRPMEPECESFDNVEQVLRRLRVFLS